MRLLLLTFILSSCVSYQKVPMEFCSEDFRDMWWKIDPEVTDNMKPPISSLCFNLHSYGELEIINYDGDWNNSYQWECVNDSQGSLDVESDDLDYYHILNQGSALLTNLDDESWLMDINFKAGLITKEAEIWPCDWDLE